MKFHVLNGAGLASVLSALFLSAAFQPAMAADAPATVADAADAEAGEMRSASDIVVLANIGYRNRTEAAEPTLSYGNEYFQRFEPLTAGDALKRVPSVTFLSDVIESDGVRLRGLAPAYTQILINGERVPGSSADRSFFMDRIPAELIDRVEIVRSSSARRTGDAIAGTLNIVLRDGLQLDGGYIRIGGLSYRDAEIEPSLGFVYGGQVGPGRLLLGLNLQGRHNPKRKTSWRYDRPGGPLVNREEQKDTRDGKDYSANATYTIEGDDTKFTLTGFYVRTDRKEDERSNEFNGATATSRIPVGGLLVDNANVNDIDQENYSFDAKLSHEWSLGKTTVKVGYAGFNQDSIETEHEIEFDRATPRLTSDRTDTRIRDEEIVLRLEHQIGLVDGIDLAFGGYAQDKSRRSHLLESPRNRFNVGGTANWDTGARNPTDLAIAFGTPVAVANAGGVNRIKEQRRDGFALVEGKGGALSWEAGVRYEHTDVTVNDYTVAASLRDQKVSYGNWLPSASIRFDISPRDRITASVARTVRRPDFNFITPATLEEELGDNDLRGNPQLRPEKAWGGDLGYEHRIGATGVVGLNTFYREISDLIEMTNTGAQGSAGAGTFIYQPRNVGNGKVYGVEFDLSTSLVFVGLPNTGIFGNLSWLGSEAYDQFGKRRFNGQSRYVYNFGFIQDFPQAGIALGATYRKQGNALDRVIAEEVKTRYGADLEIFVEKRFAKSFTVRAVASNLLNGSKDEVFNKFGSLNDQFRRSFDEYEIEKETAGPVFQIMARYAF
ncbi:TonB-dependent receptor [Sphingobium sufflavum]|uniref:TonB-dependent receptor plug domain-containing protein n=1 Tax=Sphingobium sufflavum TaxID=1129547 RepID=UPI001F169CAA|nr:TonB-dependent receptor [Sphingobium sufflavum]MCE7797595.1 TonB-dependent receptor [Sphingobium sufflavum]